MPDNPVQLRIDFGRPSAPSDIVLDLSGLVVLADEGSGNFEQLWAHLVACGVNAAPHASASLFFPVGELVRLRDLPAQAVVRPGPLLHPLWMLASHPPADGLPAALSVGADGIMRLSWFDGDVAWDERVAPPASAALLASDLSFVATGEAWEVLQANSALPVLAGRCAENLDGFVEISTTKPQLVEAAPVPGLFRVDDTHFGVACAFADALDAAGGFVWDGPRPAPPSPAHPGSLPVALSGPVAAGVAELVGRLRQFSTAAVVWSPGLGRRLTVVAAVEALDAWPLLVVCPPWNVWLWQRHLALFGRTWSLRHNRADARLVTFLDLARGARIEDPACVVFDDLGSVEAAVAAARGACRRLDGARDAFRVAVASQWPQDPDEAVALAAVLRPAEFRDDIPVVLRYPGDAHRRALEHVEAYVFRRSDSDPAGHGFRRSSVVCAPPSEDQRLAYLQAVSEAEAAEDPVSLLLGCMELTSVGSAVAVSPKLAETIRLVSDGVAAGHKVAVVTRWGRAATLLCAMLRPVRVSIADADTLLVSGSATPGRRTGATAGLDGSADVVVIRFSESLPSLDGFDEVVVLDYPWSATTLESGVGPPGDAGGPAKITVVHCPGTVDDRLAMLACSRLERGVSARTGPPDADGARHLLAARWLPGDAGSFL